jgi:hypothetical protein
VEKESAMMWKHSLLLLAWIGTVWGSMGVAASATGPDKTGQLDFSGAVLVTPPDLGGTELKAVTVLREEFQKRTGIELQLTSQWPETPRPVIAVGLQSRIKQFAGPFMADLEKTSVPGPEGYVLAVEHQPREAILIVASDARGLLYGIGRLLRNMVLAPHVALVPAALRLATSPKYPLRGHQLGYRPKVNAYDAWTEAQFDQYIRELALFGANSIELVPPRTDDQRTSPLMKVPPLEMMERLSKIIDSYGLDVWIWYPNMGKDYTSEAAITAELAEREEIFRRLKRIDQILVPAGDPGDLTMEVLFPWLERMATVLQKYHPCAKLWVAPQGFQASDRRRLEVFYKRVNAKPAWLGGVVYGPWISATLPELRAALDPEIKIRNYPDITHSVVCQYPVPNWDLAFALTLHRECYNPRPLAMKAIHNLFAQYTCGSLCYSEGINDDVNKFVWLDQGWDPARPVVETLREYARVFINANFRDELAQGFLAEERNWDGPLAVNQQVDVTLQQWQQLEKLVPAATRDNYRFQMGLLRAYYDAYIKRRLIHETELEALALEALRTPSAQGSFAALEKAESILQRAITEPVASDYKQKCETLTDSLFDKIGSQLTVKKHGAQHRTRGAFMDGIDEPLNNAAWLRAQFRLVRELPDEPARLEAIERILNRTNPGPGGFYDNLGTPASEKRVVNAVPWAEDPGTLKSPRTDFPYNLGLPEHTNVPLAWRKQKSTIFETPLRIAYDHLDPQATYSLRVVYAGEFSKPSSLVANGTFEIHRQLSGSRPLVQEFPLPHEATAHGRLELVWHGGGVAEVWLLRHAAKAAAD